VQSSVGQEQQQQQRAASVTDSITDCTSELQQLLDLQQQVQQCMLESACTQAKPTNEQQQRKKGNRRSVEAQGPEQLQQQVQDPAMQQAAAPQAPGLPQQRSSKSLQVSNLLSLQQQLAQCLKEHSCFLEQQRQQQTVAPSAAAAASSAAARGAGTSSATGTQQQQQQQGQRVGVKEAGLEQLLVLQAQLQQAARRQR
jgi:hypothetical protein